MDDVEVADGVGDAEAECVGAAVVDVGAGRGVTVWVGVDVFDGVGVALVDDGVTVGVTVDVGDAEPVGLPASEGDDAGLAAGLAAGTAA